MMKRSLLPTTLITPALLYVPFHQAVHAYLDAGTGSMIWLAVAGSITAVLAATKLYWNQIKAFVKNRLSRSRKSEEPKE
jgi:hypothetical protein